MPTNKDLKRLIRTRMKKTGEAYTAARARILRPKASPKPTTVTPREFAALAGMTDDAVKEKTGRTWALWVAALDSAGANEWPHAKIAKHLYTEWAVPTWWCQMVTVGYERIKGLRAVGQRRDGAFEASKSKTFAVPLARLYRAWSDSRARRTWLQGAKLTIRSSTPNKSIRITWSDGTRVEAMFLGKGPAKSQVAIAHTKLKSKADIAERKAYWDERLRALADVLSKARK
jgi:hypothetical protein